MVDFRPELNFPEMKTLLRDAANAERAPAAAHRGGTDYSNRLIVTVSTRAHADHRHVAHVEC